MSTSTLTRARNHYRNQQRIALAGVRAVRKVVKAAPTPTMAASAATTTLATYQLASALNGARTMASEAGRDLLSVPAAFAGTTQLGWPIETPIETIIDRLTRDLEQEAQRLTDQMLAGLDLFVQSEIIAAGADAASVEIVMEPAWTNYVRVLDLPSCDRCVILAGRIYRDLDGFARHPNCFPPGVIVSGPAALGATRRWYEGELVTLRTASGQELPATANHPILTDKGWVPANLLKVGDQVVRSTHPQGALPLVVPDEQQAPTLIEDVRGSNLMVPLGVVPTAAEDFHGDGGHGEVDVVLADRLLRHRFDATSAQFSHEEQLTRRVAQALGLTSSGAGQQLLLGMRHAADSFVSSASLRGPFFGGHATSSDSASFRHAAQLDPGGQQPSSDRVASDPVAQAQRVLALASTVRRRQIGAGQSLDAPRWDAPPGPLSVDNIPGYAALGNDLRHRLSGQVALDRIVKLERVSFRGHVYNLTSAEGWFSANGLIVSNCDCQHWPVTSWAEAEAAGLITDPQVAFDRGDVRGLSKADEQAIRDGADIQAVVNAKRGGGRRPKGMTNVVSAEIFGRTVKATTEGTTRRAEWRRKHPNLPIRLRPESIAEHAKDREDYLRLLALYGYLK